METEGPNGCYRYRQSLEEVVEAGNKHKEKALALKDIAVNLKNRVSNLREEKHQLQDKVDELEFETRNQRDLIIRMTG